MPQILRAICWALAILGVAFADRAGLITSDMANTLIIVLPVMAVLSLSGKNNCRLFERRSA